MARIHLPPKKIYQKPTHCTMCEEKLTKETEYTYLGYTKTECRPCKNKKARIQADKRKKALNEWKRF